MAKHKDKQETTEIKGRFAFQRVGQGVITFKAKAKGIVSNPIVSIQDNILPKDYAPEKYDISGEFVYLVTVTAKG